MLSSDWPDRHPGHRLYRGEREHRHRARLSHQPQVPGQEGGVLQPGDTGDQQYGEEKSFMF